MTKQTALHKVAHGTQTDSWQESFEFTCIIMTISLSYNQMANLRFLHLQNAVL